MSRRPGPTPSSSSLSKDEVSYRMDNPRRGYAIIFNQNVFDDPLIPQRVGSDVDCQSLNNTFAKLGFDVELYQDLCLKGIESKLYELSERDHSDCDGFVVIFMTHGVAGKIRSRDTVFDINILWERFTADVCRTLANKPKVFIIQACHGPESHGCPRVRTADNDQEANQLDDNQNMTPSYTLPMRADFLLALSTTPGFVSWRSSELGSWYIQTLCQHLDAHGFDQDFLTLLTEVHHTVALGQVPQDPSMNLKTFKRQLPCFISMLIRDLQFTRKAQGCKATRVKMSIDSAQGSSRDEDVDVWGSRGIPDHPEKDTPGVQDNRGKRRKTESSFVRIHAKSRYKNKSKRK